MTERSGEDKKDPVSPLVALNRVSRSFERGKVTAVREVSLSVQSAAFLAIVGPSGCGKSTLLGLMGALDEPDEGEVLYDGGRICGTAAQARFRAQTVGFVFQSFHLIPTLTASENVQIPMFEMPWNSKERIVRAETLLEEVGLAERSSHRPSQLSGGERQRVAIARSLANSPRLVLADEPTGNLDSASAARILELLCTVHDRHRTALVIVTHDKDIAARAQQTITMRDGQIFAS